MKPTKRQIELMEEIHRYAGNLVSAAEDLREVSGDDPDLGELCNLCEHADSEINQWRYTETGRATEEAIQKRDRAALRKLNAKAITTLSTSDRNKEENKMAFNKINDCNGPPASDRCAWYLRVSTSKATLTRQRENVVRFCEQHSIIVPETMRFEDVEKRDKSAKQKDFHRMLEAVKAGQVDRIIICGFDRWGMADVSELVEFRRLLIQHGVQLWSAGDQKNLTGFSEGDFLSVVATAIREPSYVEHMALARRRRTGGT